MSPGCLAQGVSAQRRVFESRIYLLGGELVLKGSSGRRNVVLISGRQTSKEISLSWPVVWSEIWRYVKEASPHLCQEGSIFVTRKEYFFVTMQNSFRTEVYLQRLSSYGTQG